jgi:hypothetical protein
LQKDYAGNTEPKWHLVNEPYIYDTTGIAESTVIANEFYMKNVFPNPLKNSGTLRFYVPRFGHVSVEIVNANGQVVDVLFNRQIDRGNHTVSINSTIYSPGLYIARMQFEGKVKIQKIMVTG